MVAVTYGVAKAAARKVRQAPKAASRTSPGFFSRLMRAMMDARLHQAEVELRLHRHLLPGNDKSR